MKSVIFTLVFLLFLAVSGKLCAQTLVVSDDPSYTTGHASSVLDVKSISKGFLAPRMTRVQRLAVSSPADGLLVYQTDEVKGFYYYNGTTWIIVAFGTGSQWITSGSDLFYNSGNVGIGTSNFNVDNPEKLLVDCGTTTSVNAISVKGSINNYLQLNIQNLSNDTVASSDIVATADNGSEETNYIDLGINSSGYLPHLNNSLAIGKANDCYLLGNGKDFLISNNNLTKSIIFLTGGTNESNARMRISPNGQIGIGTGLATPSARLHILGQLDEPQFKIQGITTQTADLMQVYNASGSTKLLTIDKDGRLLVGGAGVSSGTNNILQVNSSVSGVTPSASASSTFVEFDSDDSNKSDMVFRLSGSGNPAIFMARSGGDLATPTNLSAGSDAGSYYFSAYSGGAWNTIAGLSSTYRGNGTTAMGDLQFQTTNNDGTQPRSTTRMYISPAGNVSIGTGTTTPVSLFNVGSSQQFQVNSTGNILKINNVNASWPASQGAAGSFLKNDGSGNLSWATGVGSVTSITATAPLTGGTITSSGSIGITQSSGSANGYLSSTDWTAFNGKESALSFTSPLSRSTNTISIPAATASVNGYLTSSDWTAFNSKLAKALTSGHVFVGNGSDVATDVPISGDASLISTGALTLATTGVSAAQYGNTTGTIPSVTVDSKGRITAATERSITDSDIPDNITASNYLPLSGGTLTGKLIVPASSTSTAGLNLPHGAAPTSPVNGDIWTTTAGVFSRINGSTIGPFSINAGDEFEQNGNSFGNVATLGTNDNYDLSFETNNTEKIRITASGNIGIGSTDFDVDNPEKLLIDAGTTGSVNAIYAKATINKYFQTNIQNLSTGNQASSDIVATADNGTETTNFMDMGINGSGFQYQAGNLFQTGKANDCYLLGSGNDFLLVNSNPSKDLIFMTGGTASTNERLRLSASGNITCSGKLIASASSTTTAGVNLPHGAAPATPVNGDMWSTITGIFARINGSTVGPFGTGNGTLTSITATAPLTGGTINSTGSIGINQANGSTSGYLTSADWTTFSGKENALTFSSPLSRSTNTISIPVATGSVSGYLSSTDWMTFYKKLDPDLPSTCIFVGNGSNVATGVHLGGDATISNTGAMTLVNSGVTAGQYGNTTGTIPTVTVDAKGRVTAASSRTIADSDIPDDITASNYLPLTGGTLTGKLNTPASSATNAGLTLPHGSAPTSPVNGDVWTTNSGIFAQINGSTVGPLTNAGSNAFTQGGNSYSALAILGTNDNNSLAFETNGTEKVRILPGGNVGIGTTAPAANLDVNGSFKLGASCPVLSGILKTSVSVTDATSFDYNSSRSEVVTVTGAAVNATVIVNPRTALPSKLGIGSCYVNAANKVTINITNTGSSTSLGTVVFDITIIQ